MTDFLDQLESELVRAAGRRRAAPRRQAAARRRVARLGRDLSIVADAAVRASAVGVVALMVAAVVMVVAHHRATGVTRLPSTGGPGRQAQPAAIAHCHTASAQRATEASLRGAPVASPAVSRTAARLLKRVVAPTVTVDASSARMVRLGSGVTVVLVAVQWCPSGAATAQGSVQGAVLTAGATASAVLDLGTPATIRDGQAFRTATATTIAGQARVIAMVPAGVVRVVCLGASAAVHDRLVMISEAAAHPPCNLVYRTGASPQAS